MSPSVDVALGITLWLLLGAATLWFVVRMRTPSGRTERLNRNVAILIVVGGPVSAIVALSVAIGAACRTEIEVALDHTLNKH